MALSSLNSIKFSISCFPFSQTKYYSPPNLVLPRVHLPRSVLCLARRRTSKSGRSTTSNQNTSHNKGKFTKADDLDEDAFEALFKQLEEDLKNDEQFLDDDDDEISEKDLAMLERELEEALAEDEDLSQLLNMVSNVAMEVGEEDKEMEDDVVDQEEEEEEEDDDDDDEDDIEVVAEFEDEEEEEEEVDDNGDEEENEPVKLKGWQLRRLAYALKVGRRKTSIKNLAAELCLDRALVLELLREPPPNLLMMSAALPDKPEPAVAVSSSETTLSAPSEVITDSAKPELKVESPIHVLQRNWSAQKRLKKVHVNTLEGVYRRTKRPTNAMISSIVHVTNLPRRRVVKWFEDKRAADGVPEQRRPYHCPSESVFSK